MFRNLRFRNLRRLDALYLSDLERINLFTGRNNCGKTTILEGIYLLGI